MASYLELTDLRQSPEFQARVAIAVAVSADMIKDTPGAGQGLLDWSKRTFSNRSGTSLDAWTAALADNRNKDLDTILQGTDEQLQTQIDGIVNRYVNKGVW